MLLLHWLPLFHSLSGGDIGESIPLDFGLDSICGDPTSEVTPQGCDEGMPVHATPEVMRVVIVGRRKEVEIGWVFTQLKLLKLPN